MRTIGLFITLILLSMFRSPSEILASHQRNLVITETQLSKVFQQNPFSTTLTSEPIRMRTLGVMNGQFRIFLATQKTVSVQNFYYIWMQPQLSNGKITCTVIQIEVTGQVYTQHELLQPNPYFSSLNADNYCNGFLSPFLVGYGSGAVIEKLELKNHTVMIDLGGTVSSDAPPPLVMAGCTAHKGIWWGNLNVRSGPGLNYPIIAVIEDYSIDSPVLDWNDNWLKINYEGTVGWVWKHFARGGRLCMSDYHRRYDAWERSNTP
jgi:hypothetical protein